MSLEQRLNAVIADLVNSKQIVSDNDTFDFDAGGYIGSLEASAEGLLTEIKAQEADA